MKNYRFALITTAVIAALSLSACTTGRVKTGKKATSDKTAAADQKGAMESDIPETGGFTDASAEANIRKGDFVPDNSLVNAYFEFDAADLADSTRTALEANSRILTSRSNMDVLVEGHCDDRGTIEYNIALGQKRANAVRDYYVTMGTPLGSISTISYGKEKPVCAEQTEDCWAKNRRAETKLRKK